MFQDDMLYKFTYLLTVLLFLAFPSTDLCQYGNVSMKGEEEWSVAFERQDSMHLTLPSDNSTTHIDT